MREEHLERALAGEPDIVPSSGFVQAVMEVVRQEAAAPAPIPFPWGRALTGAFLVVVTAFVMPGAFYLQHGPGPSAGSSEIRAVLDLLVRVGQDRDAWTIAAALALTFLLVNVPRRLRLFARMP